MEIIHFIWLLILSIKVQNFKLTMQSILVTCNKNGREYASWQQGESRMFFNNFQGLGPTHPAQNTFFFAKLSLELGLPIDNILPQRLQLFSTGKVFLLPNRFCLEMPFFPVWSCRFRIATSADSHYPSLLMSKRNLDLQTWFSQTRGIPLPCYT